MIRAQVWQLHKSTFSGGTEGEQRGGFIAMPSSIQGQAGLEPAKHGFMPENTVAILRNQAGEGQFPISCKKIFGKSGR